MVYGHHERCDGRGYPVGLVKSEIHEYARLCAIADVYEALCHDLPYRRARGGATPRNISTARRGGASTRR